MATTQPRDVMAGVAARLMGLKNSAPNKAASPVQSVTASTTRSMPSPQAAAPTNGVAPPPASPRPTAPLAVAKENVAPRPPPAKTMQHPDTGAAVSQGPSLFGSAEQLALAREFSQSATQGGNKSRPGSRGPRLSASSSSTGASSRSPRAAAALPKDGGYPPVSAAARGRPSPHAQANALTSSPSSNMSRSTMLKPSPVGAAAISIQPPTSAQPQARGWNDFAAKPSEKRGDKSVKNVTESFEKAEIKHNHPPPAIATNRKPDNATSISARPTLDITNLLKDLSADAQPPPHLRTKPADAGTVQHPIVIDDSKEQEKRTTDGTHSNSTAMSVSSDKTSIPATVKEPEINGSNSTPTAARVIEPKKYTPAAMKELWSKPALASGTAPTSNATNFTSAPTNEATATEDTISVTVNALSEMVQKLSARVGVLELENFELRKQLETMQQAEERRKYLGTDNAKVPFSIDVECPSGVMVKVQVNAELKISDLIRRVRTKADLLPATTVVPRIAVDGVQIGHGITLGEVGIVKDGKVKVAFSYDSNI